MAGVDGEGVTTGRISRSNTSWRYERSGVQRFPVAELYPLGLQGRAQLVEQQHLLAAHHPLQRVADVPEQLVGRAAVEGEALDTGHHLAPQAGHLDLEELVDALAEQDEKLDPLEEGDAPSATRSSSRSLKSRSESCRAKYRDPVPSRLLFRAPHALDAH